MKTLLVRTVEHWREWLDAHHRSASEVWLVFHKQGSGGVSIERKDAVDEALCSAGWTAWSSASMSDATR